MPGSDLRCTFCGRDQRDVEKLIAGPDVYVCDRCALELTGRLREGGTTTASEEAAAGAGVKASRLKRAPRCAFCNKPESAERRFVEGSGRMVCSECLGVVLDILRMEGITPES